MASQNDNRKMPSVGIAKRPEVKQPKKLLAALQQAAASKQAVVWDNCCRYPDTNK
jgi:hypothetical protein